MARTTSAAALLAAVAVSGLQVGPGALAHARFSCPAPPRCGAPPLLCTDVAGEDIYGRKTAAEETIDVYGRSSKASDFSDMMSDPVVKVYTAYSSQHPAMPWTNKAQEEATGSGFSIRHDGALCIVTNAHVVADATYVEVRKAGDARKYVATRLKVAHECDLATLQVEDARFWEGVTPLKLGAMPSLQDEVAVVGYPEGGEGVSITQGVVSRIEIQRYAHSGTSLLAVQIDAAINPGNSGGPALNAKGEVVGVAFQLQQESQNIGYVIPVPTIQHFLADAVQGDPSRCAGFCSLGIFWQSLENQQLRDVHQLGARSGVLIRGVLPLSACAQQSLVFRGDVLLELDGQKLADDGTFAVGQQERLSFQHLIHLKFAGEPVKLRLLREGAEVVVDVPVYPQARLVPSHIYDEPQSYFIYGGLAFVALTEPYLHEWGDEWMSDAPHELVNLVMAGIAALPDEQPVILSRIFPAKLTAGYSAMMDRRCISINGEPVLNLRQMYALVQRLHGSAPYLDFELQCVGGNCAVAVESASADAVRDEILETYRIPSPASPELCAEQ